MDWLAFHEHVEAFVMKLRFSSFSEFQSAIFLVFSYSYSAVAVLVLEETASSTSTISLSTSTREAKTAQLQKALADLKGRFHRTNDLSDRDPIVSDGDGIIGQKPGLDFLLRGDHGGVLAISEMLTDFGQGRAGVLARQKHGQHSRLTYALALGFRP